MSNPPRSYERLKADILNEPFRFNTIDPIELIFAHAAFQKEKSERLLALATSFSRPEAELAEYKEAIAKTQRTMRRFRTLKKGTIFSRFNCISNKLEGFA